MKILNFTDHGRRQLPMTNIHAIEEQRAVRKGQGEDSWGVGWRSVGASVREMGKVERGVNNQKGRRRDPTRGGSTGGKI